MRGFKSPAGCPQTRSVPRHGSISVVVQRHDPTDLGAFSKDAPLDTDIDRSKVVTDDGVEGGRGQGGTCKYIGGCGCEG